MRRFPTTLIACVFLVVGLFTQSHLASAAPPQPLDDAGADRASRLVQRALESEAAGQIERRNALLVRAIELAPDYAPARWHLGYVRLEDDWIALADAERRAAADPRLAEYERLRQQYVNTPLGDLQLARWCRRQGLEDRQRFHWYRVLLIDPSHEEARRELGVRMYRGELLSHNEFERRKKEDKRQRQIVKRLKPKIQRWLREIKRGSPDQRDAALAEIRQLDEPLAIPLLVEELSGDRREISIALNDALHTMNDHRATLALARLGVVSPFVEVRSAAAERLAQHPPHEFVPTLMRELKPPIDAEYTVVTRGDGDVHYMHEVTEQSPEGEYVTTYHQTAWQVDTRRHPGKIIRNSTHRRRDGSIVRGQSVSFQPILASDIGRAEREKQQLALANAGVARAQAENVEKQIEQINEARKEQNARIEYVLAKTTRQDLGDDPQAWWAWWWRYNELTPYGGGEKPVYEQSVTRSRYKYYRQVPDVVSFSTSADNPQIELPTASLPTTVTSGEIENEPGAGCSCFPSGTPVWTMTGRKVIEAIEIGDWVLTQISDTGELAYRPVMATTIRSTSALLKIYAGKESLLTTRGHPLWVSGKGWRMAKQLTAGDCLHTVAGPLHVDRIEKEEVDNPTVYNLVVGDFGTYFVGEVGILAHDIMIRQPTQATVPGFAPERPEPTETETLVSGKP